VKKKEAVEIRVTSGTPCGGLRHAMGAHKMKETKVLPFSVVKISFLLFLAYVGTVYMYQEVAKCSRGNENGWEWQGVVGEVQFRKETKAGMGWISWGE